MKAKLDALPQLLNKNNARFYLLSGETPLLKEEALDKIRQKAFKMGYVERLKFIIDGKFDFKQLEEAVHSYALFTEQRLIECQFNSHKLSPSDKQMILQLAETLPEDLFLLFSFEKIDSSTQKTKWFKALESKGIHIPIWPIDEKQFPSWIQTRLKAAKVPSTPELIQALCTHTQGNLLAAKQQIELLSLLNRPSTELIAALSDAARFDAFDLVEKTLSGQTASALNILSHLQMEGAETILIAWALAKEIRESITVANKMAAGLSFDKACEQAFIWPKRRPPLQAYLKRTQNVKQTEHLQYCAKLDRIIKGYCPDDPWFALKKLISLMTGATPAYAP